MPKYKRCAIENRLISIELRMDDFSRRVAHLEKSADPTGFAGDPPAPTTAAPHFFRPPNSTVVIVFGKQYFLEDLKAILDAHDRRVARKTAEALNE